MRTYKTISIGFIVTLFMLLYVHQKVEIIKAEYSLQRTREELDVLIGRHNLLKYNLSKLESPRFLLASLKAEEIEFASRKGEPDGYSTKTQNPVVKQGTSGKSARSAKR